MAILGDHSVEGFLAEYWQQKPLLIKGASHNYEHVLTADELAGMACEEQVESRLITEQSGRWILENGPLDESRFAELPETNWTLLVQSVDQWLPDVRDILDEFDFLPSWRLDDVMISYATPGGGVGPHFDYYDVFLLQTRGMRRWKLGQECNQNTALLKDQPLRLLKEFEQSQEFELVPGDMLYIPAGVAHWGTGLDDECMTWSIGFRAPSAKELLTGAIERLADNLPDELRYRDSPESMDTALPGQTSCWRYEIGQEVNARLQFLSQAISEESLINAMADVLGTISTEPRYPELIEESPENDSWTAQDLNELFDNSAGFVRNDASRLAYRRHAGDERLSKLYINGEVWEVSTELAKSVCADEVGSELFATEAGRDLLLRLLNKGAYLVDA